MSDAPAVGAAPASYYAPAERASPEDVAQRAAAVLDDPLTTAVMGALGSVVAVLNRHRQILAVNEGLLRLAGVQDGADLLGLRPGEVLHCVHKDDWPGGCGTSRFCSTCGAAIAIVLAQRGGRIEERECLLTARGPDGELSIELKVRAVPLQLGEEPAIILTLQDIRDQKRREVIERVFVHDLSNMVAGLSCYATEIAYASPTEYPYLSEQIEALGRHVADELRVHRAVVGAEQGTYLPHNVPVSVRAVLDSLKAVFAYQACAEGRTLELLLPQTDITMGTDRTLLLRVLVNMTKNALEATELGGTVRVTAHREGGSLVWRVHNSAHMPDEVAMRVFQRHFSTRKGIGRGYGTYSMKLLGERCLGGEVGFVTSAERGTTFHFKLPPPA